MPYKRHQYKKQNTRYRTASRFIAKKVIKNKKIEKDRKKS